MRFGIAGIVLVAVSAIAADAGKIVPARHTEGRTGPVGLELSLLTDRILPEQSIFVRIALKNYSKKTLLVTEGVFRGSDDVGSEWLRNSDLKRQTYIEIVDAKGEMLRALPYGGRFDVNPFEVAISTPDAERSRLLAEWRSQGLDGKAIEARFRRYDADRAAERKVRGYPKINLAPGASVQSVSWCSTPPPPGALPKTCPGEGYVEFPFFFLYTPGKYRVRAVRDFQFLKKRPSAADEWSVRVATKWIQFEVVK